MKRLLLVNPTLKVGGVERKIADLARSIASRGEDVRTRLILEQAPPADSAENVFFDLVQPSSVSIYAKPATGFVPFFLYLFRHVLVFKPDIILAFSRRPSILALTIRKLVWWRRIRVIVGNDSIASRALALYVPQPFLRRLLAAQMRWLYPRAALFLVPSAVSKRDLVENFHVPVEKIRVFKNWTPPVDMPDTPKTCDLIYVGRVDPVKQLTRLVEIIGQVRQSVPHVRAVVVGDGSDMDPMRRAAREHALEDKIEFAGFQSDVGSYLARSKVFCLTSKFEGLPIAALEAMAYGLPVVTLEYEGASELVRSGETGFICADNAAFAEAAGRLLRDDELRAEMGGKAQVFVRREHGDEVLAAYVDAILRLD